MIIENGLAKLFLSWDMNQSSKVIERVKSALPQSITYILKDCGHINILTTKEKEMILKLFKES